MRTGRAAVDSQGNIIDKQPEGGFGQMRCPKCQVMATPQQRNDGTSAVSCPGCGASFGKGTMDKVFTPTARAVPKRRP